MLDRNNVKALINYAWSEVGCGIQLPEEWNDFFEQNGRVSTNNDDRRRYSRYLVRDKAVLVEGRALHCVYTCNISRSGVAFLHIEQLFPKQKFQLCLPTGMLTPIRIERCRRHGPFCFENGAAFDGALVEA